mmetsp:Transcript_18048/g.39007  ORF Transcript_18048/g.39007 Transcript_18048/m.39007 type:complete len:204 (+) Transcript_18048:158-769(+)
MLFQSSWKVREKFRMIIHWDLGCIMITTAAGQQHRPASRRGSKMGTKIKVCRTLMHNRTSRWIMMWFPGGETMPVLQIMCHHRLLLLLPTQLLLSVVAVGMSSRVYTKRGFRSSSHIPLFKKTIQVPTIMILAAAAAAAGGSRRTMLAIIFARATRLVATIILTLVASLLLILLTVIATSPNNKDIRFQRLPRRMKTRHFKNA